MHKHFIIILTIFLSLSSFLGCKKTEKNNTMEKPTVKKIELKFGLSENEQKQLFKDIVKAEDKANKYQSSAEDKILELKLSKEKLIIEYGKIEKESKILMQKYKSEVLKKYNITIEQEKEISKIAFEKNWSLD
jgi:predicted DNA-binding WGR domain protein